MATQRVFPIEENAFAAQNITIDSSLKANPTACIIPGTQPVTFTNSSGMPISITFTPNPVNPSQTLFNDIPNLPSGPAPSSPQSPTVQNGSVNFTITGGGNSNGPFGIQVGNGPLQVLISLSGSNIVCTPKTVAVPPYNNVLGIAGTIEMVPDNVNNNYSIGWPGADPFTPALTTPDSQPHSDRATTPVGDYNYTVSSPKGPITNASGGGTVRVKSV
jgi:hypothetical protein